MAHAFKPGQDAATLPRPPGAARPAGIAHSHLPLGRPPSFVHFAAVLASAAALAVMLPGCGGSSTPADSPVADSPPPPPPPPAPVTISGVAAGPLQGATACYDLNDNGGCDSGEPLSAATGASGSFTLDVAAADAGRHAVVLTVPATAVDQASAAPVGAALTFKAPASGNTAAHSVFVSPLTTMVLGQMQATGANATAAAATVQSQGGMSLSPLADYGASNAGSQQAALLARLAVRTQIALAAVMAQQFGQTDVSGARVTQADVDQAVADALRAALPALAATVADPAVNTAADVQAALAASAIELVATQPALDAAAALTAVAAAKLALAPAAAAPGDTAALRALTYTDANNWSYRAPAANTADNTPDAAGLVRFYDIHRKSTGGVVSTWGLGTLQARQADTYWSGGAWRTCPFGHRSTQTPRDAQGRGTYDYCDGYEKGVSIRTGVDISGQTLSSVISTKIRTFAGEDSGVAYSSWGPADLGVLGNATFPAGSQLVYQQTTPTENAYAYDVTNAVGTWGPAAAAGGDASSNGNLACFLAYVDSVNIDILGVGTLDELANRNPGSPCTVPTQSGPIGSSLNPNTWWSASTVSLGSVSDGATRPAGTGTFFTTAANLRVAFAGGNAVKYYSCLVRTSSGGTRSCNQIGTGSYAIQTLGDARVMTFNNLPVLVQRLNFDRVFVEHGGAVYYGYRTVSNITRSTIRLNQPAANALFSTLGIAAIAP